MAEKKRWIAMYTKHLTQKRKVYHDGFLDLHFTRKKVLLYDEADNLLESRMLKANEVVNSGERITFQAYLVDICEPKDGCNEPSSDPKAQPSNDHFVQQRKPFAVLRPNFKKSSPYSEEKKPNLANDVALKDLSPSRKMIRGFKKRELHKFAALSPDSVKPTFEGTSPLGSANNGKNDRPLINTSYKGMSGADLRRENDKYSKDVPSHKPLRDVNQILSILQRPNATATCFDINQKTPMSITKVPPESVTSKIIKVEPISPGASRDSLPQQQFMVRETSPAKTTARTVTHLNSASPSFDLGI
ncbi:unnamed protein product [Eruca vesicaria subsp. sativa]|uniref:5'-3' DNA helicase ZGRF1-like N-terminal domain-containing protein n=1 Tax=Eruca vesicaria subsp. sativa TaxID=29727 RepID=A0ABC8JFN2_ERUVS|nr:unnamed protein product [Eruca vesicaria subsp. sativa]